MDVDWSLPGQLHCNSFQILEEKGYPDLSATDRTLDDHQEDLCAHFHSPTDRTVLLPRHPSDITFRHSRHRRKGNHPYHPQLHHPTEYVPAPAAGTFHEEPLVTPTSHLTSNPPTHHNQDCSLRQTVSGDFRRILGHQEDGLLSKVGHRCPQESPLVRLFLRTPTAAIPHFRPSVPMLSPR